MIRIRLISYDPGPSVDHSKSDDSDDPVEIVRYQGSHSMPSSPKSSKDAKILTVKQRFEKSTNRVPRKPYRQLRCLGITKHVIILQVSSVFTTKC